jgi:anti-sigma regulatory factor (Ser/Thr protein kinase)
MNSHVEVPLPAVPVSVRKAREAVAAIATRLGASPQVVDDARLCVSEAASNVVRHAYRNGRGDLMLTVASSDTELMVVVRDDGVGLADFRREGDLGYGLRIIDELAVRSAISSAPNAGTEMRMVFALA